MSRRGEQVFDRYQHLAGSSPRSEAQIKFNVLTFELLQHKYRYYILSMHTLSDAEYDQLENKWEAFGRTLGYDMVNYAPWVDFPWGHPYARLVYEIEESKK